MEREKGNLLLREIDSGLFEVVLSPLVLFGHVLEAKIALLASSQSFQADQESRKLGMA